MNGLKALILGLIQGITEFFPISSSAHIKIAKQLLGIAATEDAALFDLSCHMGTVAALIFFFRKDLSSLIRQHFQLLLIALLPLIPSYFLLKPLREMATAPSFLGIFLIGTASILAIGEKLRFKISNSPKRDAFWIGSMQAMALIPGISRSASTISAARVAGWTAGEALRFSFLLSIPTVMGGMGLESLKLLASSQLSALFEPAQFIGFFSSFFAGSIILPYAFRLMEKGNLRPFAWYCLFAGIGISVYFFLNG